jgi:hypothetical protein
MVVPKSPIDMAPPTEAYDPLVDTLSFCETSL